MEDDVGIAAGMAGHPRWVAEVRKAEVTTDVFRAVLNPILAQVWNGVGGLDAIRNPPRWVQR